MNQYRQYFPALCVHNLWSSAKHY